MPTDTQEQNEEILRAFAWRLQSLSDAKRLQQSDIAETLGVSLSRVGNWFHARNFPRRSERAKLAALLGVTVDYLLRGEMEGSSYTPEMVQEHRGKYGGSPVREVPVISWSHAGEAATYEEMPAHFHGHVATTSSDPRAFAVTVEGDSMEPKFFAGDRVICEPSHSPRNGKPVVAKHADEAVQLRIFHKLPTGKIRLASLRPEIYPTVDHDLSEFCWIYPVRELVRTV